MTQIATHQYRVKKSNHAALVAECQKALAHEYEHQDLFRLDATHTYFRDDPEHPDEEIWFFTDIFDDFEDYSRSMVEAGQRDERAAEQRDRFLNLIVPGSYITTEAWTEIDELHLEY